jgi:predicted  nucleic acid-binding Zn-ribbon protein
MRETKELLLKLQNLDDEIDTLKAEEESIPQKMQDLKEGLEALKVRVEKAKSDSIDLAKLRKDREVELESLGDKKDKFKSQLFQVKTNREYEALQHEIAALDEKSSAIEDEILGVLEKSEAASKTIAEEEAELKQESERARKEQARLDEEMGKLREATALKDDERKRLVMGLDDALLKRYQRIRDSKGGLAVTSVNNGACGGCFRRIPPHEMQNLKKDDRIIDCEGCGRIIIWKWE